MLFHIVHTHGPDLCLFEDPATLAGSFGRVSEAMEAAGATVIGSWVNAPAHTFYWIVDADSAATITRGLSPIVARGTADIRPIADLAETIAMLKAARKGS